MKRTLIDFYDGKLWATSREHLEYLHSTYLSITERKLAGAELDINALELKTGRKMDNTRVVTVRDGVAVIPFDGTIMRLGGLFDEVSGLVALDTIARDFEEAMSSMTVRGLMFHFIKAPGGEITGITDFTDHIRYYVERDLKPIVSFGEGLCGSAHFWFGSAAREFFISPTTAVGSIGVSAGVRVSNDSRKIEIISSQSPNKNRDVTTERGREEVQKLVDEAAQVFINDVARNRRVTPQEVVDKYGGGGLLMGRAAVEVGMVDGIDTFEDVLAELAGRERRRSRAEARARAPQSLSASTDRCLTCGSDLLVSDAKCITCRGIIAA